MVVQLGFFSAIWQSSFSSPSISLDVRKGATLPTPGGSKIANEDDEGRNDCQITLVLNK